MVNNMNELITKLKNKTGLSSDYIYQKFIIEDEEVYLFFNEVLTSSIMINDFILKCLTKLKKEELPNLKNIIPDRNILIIEEKDIFKYIHNGYVTIITNNHIFAFEERAELDRGIPEVRNELSIGGPKDAFSENFNTNLGLIRTRIKSTNLEHFDMFIGRETKTKVGVLYMKNIVDKDTLEQIKSRLSLIDIDGIVDSSYLKENLEFKNNSFFPTVMSTERPDKSVMALLEGKVVLIVDKSPYVLIMPNFFIDFFHTTDDYYQKPINTSFIRIIRVLSFFIAIFIPALYIMITTHNHNFISLDLLLSLKAQRESVPFSALTEAFFMMIAFEILRESDLRMSSTSGSAVSILGGLILGDAAVSAGIISPIMIIVVAISAISGLVFNSIELVSAIRWWRFILMLLAAFSGIYGILIGIVILIVKLVTIKSFNKPYLTPLYKFIKTEFKDYIIKSKNKGEKLRNPILTNNRKRGKYR